jgi:hypothetical protein
MATSSPMPSQIDSVPPLNFPTEGVLPKEETGAAKFVTENREFASRGIVVEDSINVYAPPFVSAWPWNCPVGRIEVTAATGAQYSARLGPVHV